MFWAHLVKKKKKPFLTPLVKKIVSMHQITPDDLNSINGTGINGRINKTDIEKYLDSRSDQPKQMSPVRKTLIKNLEKVAKEVPSASMMLQVDFTNILKKKGEKISPAASMIWALGKVLGEFPKLFSSYSDQVVKHNSEINIGVAINRDDDLYVPVVKSVESLSLVGVAKELARLKDLVIDKKLTYQDMSDGNFTLTNFGMGGVDIGVPMLQLDQNTKKKALEILLTLFQAPRSSMQQEISSLLSFSVYL